MRRAPFPWPDDGNAWWTILASVAGGWGLSSLGWSPAAAGLALASAGLFLSSEWLSRLSGRSRGGPVRRPEGLHPWGLCLLLAALLGAALFCSQLDPADHSAWASTMATAACLVALMFILRLEWMPWDSRLIFLTHLLLTLPTLLLGFLRWGVGDPRAWELWLPLAAYFPAQALFGAFWLQGSNAPASSRLWLAGPLLAGAAILAGPGTWLEAVFLLSFLARSIQRLMEQQRPGFQREPGLGPYQRFARELHTWNALFCLIWILR